MKIISDEKQHEFPFKFDKTEKAVICNKQYAMDKKDAFFYLLALEEENNLNQIKKALKEMQKKKLQN